MEKFVKWADEHTGIHPFLPLSSKATKEANIVVKAVYFLKWYLLGSVIALVRLPFVALFWGLLVAIDVALRLVPIGFVRRLMQTFLEGFIARVLLFMLGFAWIDAAYVPSRRRNAMPSGSVGGSIGNGHVIICNHVSYVDLLYLAFRFAPQFTLIDASGTKVVPVPLYRALAATMFNQPPVASGGIRLSELLKKAEANSWGPVVLMPEGTATNGQVILGCQPVIDAPIEKSKVHALSFFYDYNEFAPQFPCGSVYAHLWFLCGQLTNKLKVKHIIDADLPEAPADADASAVSGWADSLFSMLASATSVRNAKIQRSVKYDFLQYFSGYKKQYKSK